MKRFDSMFSCNTRTATDATCAAPAASCASENFIITMDTAILAVSIFIMITMLCLSGILLKLAALVLLSILWTLVISFYCILPNSRTHFTAPEPAA